MQVLLCVLGYSSWIRINCICLGSKVVPAAELALLSMTEVVLGPIWVWLFLGEKADFMTYWVGYIVGSYFGEPCQEL